VTDIHALKQSLVERYRTRSLAVPLTNATLQGMATRGSCRNFTDQAVDPHLVHLLCAIALASPTKSDLQQRDIIVVDDKSIRENIEQLLGGNSWTAGAPVMLVFCGNNRRQRQLSNWHNTPFPNDHLDAFFNASVDAGIALSAFVTAAESTGLGCCPVSQIRNHCTTISTLLELPEYVFPVAGLALGWPASSPAISMRLPLSATVHKNRFCDKNIKEHIANYSKQRTTSQPYAQQRNTDRFGESPSYGWSEDKARQYAEPQRTDFGEFIKSKGFTLK
jgi:nitroreductase/FMN reductase [NAD(P)H]